MSNLVVYKSNKVIEASYRLSINEQKIILACIAKHDSTQPLQATDTFKITAYEFAELTGIDINNAYKALDNAAKSLLKRCITIDNPIDNPKLKRVVTHWLESIGYLSDNSTLELRFALRMLPYLGQLKSQFTKYELRYIGSMSSKYGIRIYELLAQYRNFGRREIQLDWLRKNLEMGENEYSAINDFKKRVIDVAIADINKHSDLNVHAPIYTKTGRNITGIVFDFKVKAAATMSANQKSAKKIEATNPHDDLTEWENLHKRFGDKATIPKDIIEQLKQAGRW